MKLTPEILVELTEHLKNNNNKKYKFINTKFDIEGKICIEHRKEKELIKYYNDRDVGFYICWDCYNFRTVSVEEIHETDA